MGQVVCASRESIPVYNAHALHTLRQVCFVAMHHWLLEQCNKERKAVEEECLPQVAAAFVDKVCERRLLPETRCRDDICRHVFLSNARRTSLRHS
jgi:hypothetical protein